MEDNGVAGNGVDGSEDKLKFEELGVGVDEPFDAKDELIADGGSVTNTRCVTTGEQKNFDSSTVLESTSTGTYFWNQSQKTISESLRPLFVFSF